MKTILLFTIFFILLSIVTIYINKKEIDKLGTGNLYYIYSIFLMLTVFLIKLIYSTKTYFYGDMSAFNIWMHSINEEGLSGFYSRYGVSYPPFHMFIIYIIGKISKVLSIGDFTSVSILLFKFPAIFFDFLSCILIFKIGKKHLKPISLFLVVALFSLNPGIIINSTQWGQVDSIYTFFIAYMCYCISEKKMCRAYYVFATAILFKYQAIIFTPVLIYGIVENVFLSECNRRKIFKNLFQGLSAIVLILLSHFPFIFGHNVLYNVNSIKNQYTGSLTAFPCASWNAFNVWTLFGLNLVTQEKRFLNITYKNWGMLAIVLLVMASGIIWWRYTKNQKKYEKNNIYCLVGGFIISTMFMFSVRMHERYLYPALLLLFMYYTLSNNIYILVTACAFSVAQYWNVGHIFYGIDLIENEFLSNTLQRLISLFTLMVWFYFVFLIIKLLKKTRSEINS